ncbi:MAG: N-succinylarginine dihydrolase [Hahellaceae bacterium]|nr:N-succinylarginine dihydrolase [Hahellaceae bacterium]MCP5168794.1 N-succinylarginine dihydrolase [Hahellaceae bacterium]
MRAHEVNFDGLVGPTHNYSGLSYGNVASEINSSDLSNPKAAALQGLQKMKALHDLGFKQGVIPPLARPSIQALRDIGFSGSEAEVLQSAYLRSPILLAAASSASSMWTANACTVSPSADTQDSRVHFTPANLNAKFHRSLEHRETGRILQAIFNDENHFAHHAALPAVAQFGDEGAANHTRFCAEYDREGVEFFVYGRVAFDESQDKPKRYPARQTREACEAIARLHGLPEQRVVYAQQKPATIDAGVFHNDVIAVGNRNVLFYHEEAFLHTESVLANLQHKLQGASLIPVCVRNDEVSVLDAVQSYLFNSQLLTKPNGKMLLVVPHECREVTQVSNYLDKLIASGGPIDEVKVFNLTESMKNGGGPACLRLRVVLTEQERLAANPGVMMSETLYQQLTQWVNKHYRDRLTQADLADPALLQESRTALDELTQIMRLGSVYPFQ